MEIFSSASFARNLTRLMSERGWTQKELAVESGISQPSISRYLKESTEPKVSDLIALARSFSVSLDLLTGHESSGLRVEMPVYGGSIQEWRDRARDAEAKVEMLKSGLAALIKKI